MFQTGRPLPFFPLPLPRPTPGGVSKGEGPQSRPFVPWTAALDFTVTRSGGGLLSLHTDAAERHGTARPLLVRSGETWDLTSGTPVSLSSLFPSGRRWRQQVLSAIEEQCAGRAASG